MAQERAKLVNAAPLLGNDGFQQTWDSQNGKMFAYDLELDMNGETVHVKAFSKKEDSYPLAGGTDIVFNTDWVEKYGYAYAKGVKDANSQYAQGGGGRTGGTQRPATPQGRPQQAPAPAQRTAPAPKGLSDKQILTQCTKAALKYLQVAASQKEINLNLTTIKDIGSSYASWVKEFDNKTIALQALDAAIETAKLNESLGANEAAINNSKELKAVAALYYEFFTA